MTDFRPMRNKLIIGLADKTPALPTKQGFLLIDDGPIADHFLKSQKRAVLFDPKRHSFNPLKGMTYRQARELAAIAFGSQRSDTLTVRNGKRALTRMLLAADRIDHLAGGNSDADKEALATIDDLLLSPILRKVLCGANANFSFKATSNLPAHQTRQDACLAHRTEGEISLH